MKVYLAITNHEYGSYPNINVFEKYIDAVNSIDKTFKSYGFKLKNGNALDIDQEPLTEISLYKKTKVKMFDQDGGPKGFIISKTLK